MTKKKMVVDIETYSDVDLKKAGLYKYAESPAFQILLVAWCVGDEPVQLADLTKDDTDTVRAFLQAMYREDTELYAYNAAFEHYCINTWLKRQKAPLVPASEWRDIMAHAAYCGYPAGLAATGEALGLAQDKRKMTAGAALIRKFCVPQAPNLMNPEPWRVKPEYDPDKWALFCEYCKQDVESEREIEKRLTKWKVPDREQGLWTLTTECNQRGTGVDMDLVTGALDINERLQADLTEEARTLTGLDNPRSVGQVLNWLNKEMDAEGELTDLRKGTVSELLAAGLDNTKVERMLELRQLMGKTSTKKYDALRAAVCDDGRVKGMMQYYGAARTGRWAGRIVQPQNLPQNHLTELDAARSMVKARDAEMLELCYGSIPDTLSQLIRTALIPPEGKRFAVADYSAIEARVVAWLAGETWVLDAFRDGQDIYCATASRMFGVPVEKHGANAHLRQRGKVAVLALGYGGGEGALKAMGALKMGIPEEDLPGIKADWRRANPHICAFWRRVEDAAIRAMESGSRQIVQIKSFDPARARANEAATGAPEGGYSAMFLTGAKLTFRKEATPEGLTALTIELPTKRKLFYAQPFISSPENLPGRKTLHYYSVEQSSRKWAETSTWGGKLVENITQAVARDCLAETLFGLHETGLDPVFHVHDEVICEIDDDKELDTVLSLMAKTPSWAPNLPLKGAGFVCDYYQKD